MKRWRLVIWRGVSLLVPLPLWARLSPPPTGPLPTTFGNLTDAFFDAFVIADWLFAFVLAGGVITILVGAFQYLTASDDAEKLSLARSRIIYGLVGVAIGTLALALVNIATRFFGGTGFD